MWPKVVTFGLPIGDLYFPKLKSIIIGHQNSYLLRFPCGNFFTFQRPYLIDGNKGLPTLSTLGLSSKRQKYLKFFHQHHINLQTLKAIDILDSHILPIDCAFLSLVESLPQNITRESSAVDLINHYSFYPEDLDDKSLCIVAVDMRSFVP
jgi:hypothetical protein